ARSIYRAVLSPGLAEVTVEAIRAAPAGVSPGSAGVSPGDTRSQEPPADHSSSCISRDGMHSPTTTGRQPPARDRVEEALRVLARRDLDARRQTPGLDRVRCERSWLQRAQHTRRTDVGDRLRRLAIDHPYATGPEFADL